MANTIIDMRGGEPATRPWWYRRMLDAGYAAAIGGRTAFTPTPDGFLSLSAVGTETAWCTLPVLGNLPDDSFEVLLQTRRVNTGQGNNYINTGSGIFIGGNKDLTYYEGYYIVYGMGSARDHLVVYRRPESSSSQVQLIDAGSTGIPSNYEGGTREFLRVRREGTSLKARRWLEGTDEPVDWHADLTDEHYQCSHVSLLSQGYGVIMYFEAMAVATDGDTASLEAPSTKTLRGVVPLYKVSREVSLFDLETHAAVASFRADENTGIWGYEADASKQYYIRLDQTGGETLFKPIFAEGAGYLAGEFPDGLTTVDGVPTESEVRALLRTEGFFDGFVVGTTESRQDGTWVITGLNPDLTFDVVARKEGFNDVIVSRVRPQPVESLYVSNAFQLGPEGQALLGYARIWGGEAPYSVEVISGEPPPGTTFSVVGGIVTAAGDILAYGNYEWGLRITDNLGETYDLPCSVKGTQAYPVADVVDWEMSTFATTTSRSVDVPANTQEGDLLVFCAFHRSTLTVPAGWTQASTGTLTAGATQVTEIWTKVATASDLGSTISVSQSSSQRMALGVIALRSVYGTLEVVDSASIDDQLGRPPYAMPTFAAQEHDYYYLSAMSLYYSLSDRARATVVYNAEQLGRKIYTSSHQVRLAIGGRFVRKGQAVDDVYVVDGYVDDPGDQHYNSTAIRLRVLG